jgi:hypothetical protein
MYACARRLLTSTYGCMTCISAQQEKLEELKRKKAQTLKLEADKQEQIERLLKETNARKRCVCADRVLRSCLDARMERNMCTSKPHVHLSSGVRRVCSCVSGVYDRPFPCRERRNTCCSMLQALFLVTWPQCLVFHRVAAYVQPHPGA